MADFSQYTESEVAEIERRREILMNAWQTRKEPQDIADVNRAFDFAVEAHAGQKRKSGEPYIFHPIEVATIAASEIGLGRTSIICALLHDVVEDTPHTLQEIEEMFDPNVARIIDGLTKISQTKDTDTKESIQAQSFKKIIDSLSYDTRVILIKLSDRLHNMRTLDSMPTHKQMKIAAETNYLYAPLAYRFGLYYIKTELGDLSMKYLYPDKYKAVKQKIEELRELRTQFLLDFIKPVVEECKKFGINIEREIVQKSTSDIINIMEKEGKSVEEIDGLFSINVIVDCPVETENIDCWKVYAVMSKLYTSNTRRLRDWISTPKMNGYESLHAVLMSKVGQWACVQIRSRRMHDIAVRGFAAYWKYKTGEETESGFDIWFKRDKEIMNYKNEDGDLKKLIDEFHRDLFAEEVFVFTPKGELKSVPKGSTPLDFAYHIHSEVGNHFVSALINGKPCDIGYELQSGDQVEIVTSPEQTPQSEWLEYVKSAYARSKLEESIKDFRVSFREKGKELYRRIMEELHLDASKDNRARIMKMKDITKTTDFYYYVAIGKIDLNTIIEALKEDNDDGSSILRYITFGLFGGGKKKKEGEDESGKYIVAPCCTPIPGDEVVQFQLENGKIEVHQPHCIKANAMMATNGNKILNTPWHPAAGKKYIAWIRLTAKDNIGLLNRITELLSKQMKISMNSIQMEANNNLVEATIAIFVTDTNQLNEIIKRLLKLSDIERVTRINPLSLIGLRQ